MRIDDWRTEIDEIDHELLRLLNRRARAAMHIGALKRVAGLPICDADRERQVLSQMQDANDGPLDEQAIAELFRLVIRESRRAETQHAEKLALQETH